MSTGNSTGPHLHFSATCPAGDGTGDHESQFFEWPGLGDHWRCLRCGQHLCAERPCVASDKLRDQVGRALESISWVREHLDDDSEEAKAFDTVHAYAQGLDDE